MHAKFVIIGDGVAGRSALETLRGRGVPASKVLVLGGKDGPSSRAASLDTERSLVICEDGETTAAQDNGRMQWAADDLIFRRAPLSRWSDEFKEEYKRVAAGF